MPTMAFLTDSTLCIGCKACEVACKEWNEVPADGLSLTALSYDNTLSLGHSTWRHVKFLEHDPAVGVGGNAAAHRTWEFSSDVCKHCEVAGCLEHCPTGAIVRTEFDSVFVQTDVCNGCGYCVVGCPFGVIDRRPDDGRAFKCTFCYDRQKGGLMPACAKVCPTESIKFGTIEEMQAAASSRVEELHARGMADATLYDGRGGSVEGAHALFILRGDPRAYNLPIAPDVPTALNRPAWQSAVVTAGAILAGTVMAFLGARTARADEPPQERRAA